MHQLRPLKSRALLPRFCRNQESLTVSSMSESVILSPLQLCQQAISSLTQTNKSDENKYSLHSAMTSSTNTGIPAANISDVDLVSTEIRADLLAGKDMNLNILLIPNYTSPALKKIKEKDERLSRNLSLDEFFVPFWPIQKQVERVRLLFGTHH